MKMVGLPEPPDVFQKCKAVLALKKVTIVEFAASLGYSLRYVKDVLLTNRPSPRARAKIAQGLGFASWDEFERAELLARVA